MNDVLQVAHDLDNDLLEYDFNRLPYDYYPSDYNFDYS